ncbi:gamma-glutamyl peptidase 4-like [Xenia sp. Carnegie-2017]|uniref:gamma-glutamyl peptidase 4-like n=1 Tax=Xenia sp. Carnegie-2017 TaxID=2897299 RepID=UPI001F04A8D5|nr:gamma-glutamyl peptidase 4-like [Xenia sp. Carnegie-2017]
MSKSSRKLFGVIVCDSQAKWGGPDGIAKRIENMLSIDNAEWKRYRAEYGEFPSEEELNTFQGFYITGSKHSVNDEAQTWIKKLELFIQKAHALKRPKVYGSCFGHQAIAKALGGKVGANPSKQFICYNEEIVMYDEDLKCSKFLNHLKKISDTKKFHMLQSHGECVEELPPNAINVASSASCKHEIILFSDNIVGCQSHADFIKDDLSSIILPSLLESNTITKDEFDKATESLKRPDAGSDVAHAIQEFLCCETQSQLS